MSGKRAKLLRKAFEKNFHFSEIDRDNPDYKTRWHEFKKEWKRGRL